MPTDKHAKDMAFYEAAKGIPSPAELPPTNVPDLMNNLHEVYKHDKRWQRFFQVMIPDHTVDPTRRTSPS